MNFQLKESSLMVFDEAHHLLQQISGADVQMNGFAKKVILEAPYLILTEPYRNQGYAWIYHWGKLHRQNVRSQFHLVQKVERPDDKSRCVGFGHDILWQAPYLLILDSTEPHFQGSLYVLSVEDQVKPPHLLYKHNIPDECITKLISFDTHMIYFSGYNRATAQPFQKSIAIEEWLHNKSHLFRQIPLIT